MRRLLEVGTPTTLSHDLLASQAGAPPALRVDHAGRAAASRVVRTRRPPFPTACLVLLVVGCGAVVDAQLEQQVLVPAQGSPISVPFAPGGVALGDVNNDDEVDLMVRSAESPVVAVLLGSGDGQFRVASASPIELQDYASEIALADVNGDSRLDLVLGNHNSYMVQILLGDGSGGFSPASNSPFAMKDGENPHTHGLAVGDLNNDGDVDLVTGDTADGQVAVALGDGLGGFSRADDSPFAVAPGPYPLTLADLDLDGHLDVAVTSTHNGNGESGTSLTVLLGDGGGGFERSQVPLRTQDPWFVATGDVNGDQTPDLVTSHWESREVSVLLGRGGGSFVEASGSPFTCRDSTWYLGIADFDGDGNQDVAGASGDHVCLMVGDGQGGFRRVGGAPLPTAGGSWRLAIGTFGEDARPYVVTSDLEGSTVTVLLARYDE